MTRSTTPTAVLVHGAFADAWSFATVIRQLLAEGMPVVAPAVPSRTLGGDAAYVSSVIREIPGPVVLVGHYARASHGPPRAFVRLGRQGYSYVMGTMQSNARALADNLRGSGRFRFVHHHRREPRKREVSSLLCGLSAPDEKHRRER